MNVWTGLTCEPVALFPFLNYQNVCTGWTKQQHRDSWLLRKDWEIEYSCERTPAHVSHDTSGFEALVRSQCCLNYLSLFVFFFQEKLHIDKKINFTVIYFMSHVKTKYCISYIYIFFFVFLQWFLPAKCWMGIKLGTVEFLK